MTAIIEMPICILSGLLKKSVEKEQENFLREEWLSLYPLMQSGTIKLLSFEEYKKTRIKVQCNEIEKEDIFKEMVALAQSTKGAR